MSSKIVHARIQERIGVKTQDAILSAEDPNRPSPNSMGGITDVGLIWNGIQKAVDSLPAQARDEVVKRMSVYVRMQGGDPGPDGLTTTNDGRRMSDGAIRAGAMRDSIRGLNDANRAHWADIEASRPRR